MQLTSTTQSSTTKRASVEPPSKTLTAAELAKLSAEQLDGIFRNGKVGEIPNGNADGTAIVLPGNSFEPLIEKLVHSFAWKGKIINAAARTLKNKISMLGIPAIAADLYWDRSWFDGNECIVLDYSKRSIVAKWVRDEIRLVGPGLYLGLVFVQRKRLLYFTLQFPV